MANFITMKYLHLNAVTSCIALTLLMPSCGEGHKENANTISVPASSVDTPIAAAADATVVINWADSVTMKKSDYIAVDSHLLLLKKRLAADTATKNINTATKAEMKKVNDYMKKKNRW